jgi:hypothetical protein
MVLDDPCGSVARSGAHQISLICPGRVLSRCTQLDLLSPTRVAPFTSHPLPRRSPAALNSEENRKWSIPFQAPTALDLPTHSDK